MSCGFDPRPRHFFGLSFMNQLTLANRNIKLYVFVRIFAKRVFLPLSAIYFMDSAGFTIRDIGILAAFYSLVQLVAEVPTGYFADRVGRVASLRLGGLSLTIATLCFVLFPSHAGIFTGVFFEALGYSFLGGAGEAMIHDSLVVKGQEHEYTKVMSRTMSISLVANAILLALVPMTYALNPRYPFIIGALAYFALFMAAVFMRDVTRTTPTAKFFWPVLSQVVGKRFVLLFGLTFGIIGALYIAPTDFVFVALREYGIAPAYLGWIIAASSVVGAAMGPFIPFLRSLKLSSYILIDLFVLVSLYLAVFSHSASLLAVVLTASLGFWRYRKIIYQSYLLHKYPGAYKATLLSTMSNLEQLNNVWLTLAIASSVAYLGIAHGFGIMAIFALLIAPIYLYATLRFFRRTTPLPVALANPPQDIV